MPRRLIRSTELFQAKRTKYGRQWFKSNLEAMTAESLDVLGIRWEYETRCFRDRRYAGGQYTPDFYLPDHNIYVEVVGRPDDRHVNNARVFCHQDGDNYDMEPYWPPSYPLNTEHSPGFFFVVGGGDMISLNGVTSGGYPDIGISTCGSCGRTFFLNLNGPWVCSHCGQDYGKHHLSGTNLFAYAGRDHA